MSKGARNRNSERRRMEKKRRKEAKRALYKSYSEQGRKNNSKRATKHKVISSVKGNHVMLDCGNVGCEKCYPQYAVVPQNMVTAA